MFGNDFSSFLITSVPDSPHEPDPEPYEPMPPRLIPLDEVSTPNTHSLTHCLISLVKHIVYMCLSGLPAKLSVWSSLQDSSMLDDSYGEPMDTTLQQGSAMAQNESSKLPPVLANLMGNLSNNSRSPQATNTVNNPVAPTVNVQELLSSIMVNKW